MENRYKESKIKKHPVTYGAFWLGNTEIALDSHQIQEVINFPESLSSVVKAPKHIIGMFNLRGNIIPLVSLNNLIKKTECEIIEKEKKKVAIIKIDDVLIGVYFDSTSGIIKVYPSELEQTVIETSSENLFMGFLKLDQGRRLIQLLNPKKILNSADIDHMVSKTKTSTKESNKSQIKFQGVVFSSGSQKNVLPMESIYEIVKVSKIHREFPQILNTQGLFNLRGMNIALINFEDLMGNETPLLLEEEVYSKSVIILKLNHNLKLGLLVDSIDKIINYSEENKIERPTESKSTLATGYISYENETLLLTDNESVLKTRNTEEIVRVYSKLYESSEKPKHVAKSKKETFISFFINDEYCFPILDVHSVENLPQDLISPMGSPGFVKGLFNYRNKIIPLLDLKKLHQLEDSCDKNKKVVVVKKEEEYVGIMVDSIESIFSVYAEDKHKCPQVLTSQTDKKIKTLIKELLLIFNKGQTGKTVKIAVLNREGFFQKGSYLKAI